MSVFSQLQNRFSEQRHTVPPPDPETNPPRIFQHWHQFDPTSNTWAPLNKPREPTQEKEEEEEEESSTITETTPTPNPKLVLATWNVETGAESASRITAIISHLQTADPPIDIIFFQEVSRTALTTILSTPWVRENWYSSEADATNWGVRPFATITMVSKSRLGDPNNTLGPIFRLKYPSRFERDALCSDIFLPGSRSGSTSRVRVRLINVHLDSLPIQPSKRPVQLSIVASYLRKAGRGLVAGDFNPVLAEDEALVGANGLKDVWAELRPDEDGFTWGADRVQRFPPNRMDKVAVVGLRAFDIRVVPPGKCVGVSGQGDEGLLEGEGGSLVWWSDHSGVVCSFGLE